jgi:gluconokinase
VPWLEQLNAILRQASRDQKTIVLACSALKQSYRDRLTAGLPRYCIVYLKGTFDFIHARLARRKNHFMPADLLQSQFADLEEPKDAIVLEISQTQAAMIAAFEEAIGR